MNTGRKMNVDAQCIFWRVNMIYFVGIDIAKYKHDCFIAAETTIVTKTPLTFENTKEGFSILLDLLSSLDKQNDIRIGLKQLVITGIT
jgi:hypothetical protein